MTTMRATIPTGPWTVADLDDLPRDSPTVRYELIDGALLVTSEPTLQHQRVNARLLRVLQDAAPPGLEVFLPIDVRLSPVRQIVPDITVVRSSDATGKRLSGRPLLVVEVQSPSTRAVDLTLKRRVLEETGVPSYWLVEPDALVLTVLELDGGTYREVARVSGDQPFDAVRPFPVRIVPADLSR
ncbi:MAG: Uma2 family endonuclease [Actinobacteria bacterium]|nr:Uma2 family endonuclease [Actinomycetota bacterium]